VGLDCLYADDQLVGHFLVGETLGDDGGHLALSPGQPAKFLLGRLSGGERLGRGDYGRGPAAEILGQRFILNGRGHGFDVGAGGVEDDREAPRTIVSVDSSGEWAATAPNGVTDLTATPRPGGTFELNWRYDETGQSARPDQFAIFSGTGSPAAVNLAAPVATVSYRFRRGRFRWVSNGFSHATIVHWQVRAVSVAGDSGPVSNMATSTAMATAGAMTVTAVPLGAIDL